MNGFADVLKQIDSGKFEPKPEPATEDPTREQLGALLKSMTARKAGEALGITRSKLYQLMLKYDLRKRSGNYRITPDQVRYIRAQRGIKTLKALAKECKACPQTIWLIQQGKSRTEVV